MKNIGAFLLLFVILISMLPCTDEVGCTDETTSAYQLSHEESSEENCSSICMCACCGQRMIAVEQLGFRVQTSPQFYNHTIKDYQFYLELLSQNIWQPPKLA
ncbi:hypothetical protein [Pedobacter sp. SL55]|uniref:hypothetical protein n=1 Tax=Pedobacter sp. SL55 TaxID=2995161 RepID=UPI00226DD6AD|nr:hypothetical protein [Pedobacter sp. SL55]WAC42492.1 hypothetical protein OVA16_09110 [Pedobacter sp. SL55]